MPFLDENQLVETALRRLPLREWLGQPAAEPIYRQRELRGLFGVPDVVVACLVRQEPRQRLRSIAFEMKLSDWKRGLAQAFRYRSFACECYVVLDQTRIGPALDHTEHFVRANVGLIGIHSHRGFTVHHRPHYEPPFCRDLAKALEAIVMKRVPRAVAGV
jgi:hypothetical protein